MNGSFLYWLLKLDAIRELILGIAVPFVGVGIGGGVVVLACLYIGNMCIKNGDESGGVLLEFGRALGFLPGIVLPIGIVLHLLYTMIPSTKEMAIIYVVPKVTNSVLVQDVPKKMLQLSSEWLEELRPVQKITKEEF